MNYEERTIVALERIAAALEQRKAAEDKLMPSDEENGAEGLKVGDIAEANYKAPAHMWNAVVRVEKVLPNGEYLIRSEGRYAVVPVEALQKVIF